MSITRTTNGDRRPRPAAAVLPETTSTHSVTGHHVTGRETSAGLTAAGAVLLSMTVTLIGGLVDVITTRSLGWCFAACFVLSSGWTAARVVRRDLLAAVIAPPLVFAVTAFLALQLLPSPSAGRWVVREGLDLATALALGAPVLLAGTAIAGGIALVRRFGRRRS